MPFIRNIEIIGEAAKSGVMSQRTPSARSPTENMTDMAQYGRDRRHCLIHDYFGASNRLGRWFQTNCRRLPLRWRILENKTAFAFFGATAIKMNWPWRS